MQKSELIAAAAEVREHAYAPYSRFSVGAALLCEDGSVFTGCNVEAASYGNTICAERAALVQAVGAGKRGFVMLAVTAGTEQPCTPCGICRQMLYEFSPDMVILSAARDGSFTQKTLRELLPDAFSGVML